MTNDLKRCFEILDVPPEATYEEAKAAYKLMAKFWHPDKHSHDEKLQAKAIEMFKKLNNAWSDVEEYFKNGYARDREAEEYERRKREEVLRAEQEKLRKHEEARLAKEKERAKRLENERIQQLHELQLETVICQSCGKSHRITRTFSRLGKSCRSCGKYFHPDGPLFAKFCYVEMHIMTSADIEQVNRDADEFLKSKHDQKVAYDRERAQRQADAESVATDNNFNGKHAYDMKDVCLKCNLSKKFIEGFAKTECTGSKSNNDKKFDRMKSSKKHGELTKFQFRVIICPLFVAFQIIIACLWAKNMISFSVLILFVFIFIILGIVTGKIDRKLQ